MHERIYNIAAHTISPSAEEQPLLDILCSSAEAELTMRLREGVTAESCGNIYIFSAALMATADMMLLRSTSNTEDFTAGDVSIRHNSERTCATASALRRQADSLMAPFCGDDDFAFVGV